ncbi:MAG: hypothetical protein K8S54_10510 [Spirochaetia bacterium]|nr:hypothetical protein [Spirochaetia bacterium]
MKNRTVIRVILLLVCLTLSTAVIYASYQAPANSNTQALLVNLGTEVLGLGTAIIFVEYILERQRELEKCFNMAQATLHEIQYAVWVWQGGNKEFNVYLLLEVLSRVKKSDRLAVPTENLLLVLGTRAGNRLRIDQNT